MKVFGLNMVPRCFKWVSLSLFVRPEVFDARRGYISDGPWPDPAVGGRVLRVFPGEKAVGHSPVLSPRQRFRLPGVTATAALRPTIPRTSHGVI